MVESLAKGLDLSTDDILDMFRRARRCNFQLKSLRALGPS
jgi:hypothetical protein